jgi:hypothetical protein
MNHRLPALLVAAMSVLAACAGPVEFSASANPPPLSGDNVNADFSGMDRAMDGCKAAAKQSGPGQCTQVRAYEACMKTRGYIAVLGPENPPGCGQPAWEEDVRKWLE